MSRKMFLKSGDQQILPLTREDCIFSIDGSENLKTKLDRMIDSIENLNSTVSKDIIYLSQTNGDDENCYER